MNRKKAVFLMFLGIALVLAGCNGPLLKLNGNARLELRLGGAILPTVRAVNEDQRVIIPVASNSIQIRIWDDGEITLLDKNYLLDGNSISINSLPSGKTLWFNIEALDSKGDAISGWYNTEPIVLTEGPQGLEAKLLPYIEPEHLQIEESPMGFWEIPSIEDRGYILYQLPTYEISSDYFGSEIHLMLDTGRAEWGWLGVYDSDWEPYETVSQDATQGWAVIKWPTPEETPFINIILANIIDSPGYPQRALNDIGLRLSKAIFVTEDGSTDGADDLGSSGNPAEFNMGLYLGLKDSGTLLVRSGNYTANSADPISGYVRIYGGFGNNWKTRNGTSTVRPDNNVGNGTPTVQITNMYGLIDKMHFAGAKNYPFLEGFFNTVTVVTSDLVINNSSFEGLDEKDLTEGVRSVAMMIFQYVEIEVSRSRFYGGSLIGEGEALYATAAIYRDDDEDDDMVYIHDSTLDGGTATGPNAVSLAVQAEGKMIMARNHIWGGTAKGSESASTAGIIIETESDIIIANSIISAGYAYTAEETVVETRSSGIQNTSGPNNVYVAGSIIDGGSGPKLKEAAAIHIKENATGQIILTGNILTVSGQRNEVNQDAFTVAAWDNNGLNNIYIYGNTALAVTPFRDADSSMLDFQDENNTFPHEDNYKREVSAGAFFTSFPGGFSGNNKSNAEKWFNFYGTIASAWRAQAVNRRSPEIFYTEDYEHYPAILMDMDGRMRSGNWNHGVYQ